MRKELEDTLAQNYSFFTPLDRGFGRCEHSDGWYTILERLLYQLTHLDLPPEFRIVQVKEKFGGLCVHVGGTDGMSHELFYQVYRLLGAAEDESYRTCERCGKPATLNSLNNGGRVRTLCAPCYNGPDAESP